MLENLSQKQKIIVTVIAIAVLIGIISFIYNKNQTKDDTILENDILITNTSTNNNLVENESAKDLVVVHITGSVKNPGIVKLSEGSRIEDAIQAAGGLTENADISKVNLAYVLDDGIKIKIPSITDDDIGDEEIINEESGENIIENDTTSPKNNKSININKATETELETLPGIGASLASRIVEYRKQNGNFSSIEDIKNVSGIGDSKYLNIKDFITVK